MATVTRASYGGVLSLLAFIAAAIFFGFEVFGQTISDVPLTAAGLFSVAIAFVLERFGL